MSVCNDMHDHVTHDSAVLTALYQLMARHRLHCNSSWCFPSRAPMTSNEGSKPIARFLSTQLTLTQDMRRKGCPLHDLCGAIQQARGCLVPAQLTLQMHWAIPK